MVRLGQLTIAIIMLAVVSSALVTRTEALVTTSITELHFPATALYNTNPQLEATVRYEYAMQGYFLAVGIYDVDDLVRTQRKGRSWSGDDWKYYWTAFAVSGNPERSDPLPCLWDIGFALCLIQFRGEHYPPYLFGSGKVTFQLRDLKLGTHHLGVAAMMYLVYGSAATAPMLYGQNNGIKESCSYQEFTIEVVQESAQTITSTSTTSTSTVVSSSATIASASTTATSTGVTTVFTSREATTTVSKAEPESYQELLPIVGVLVIVGLALVLMIYGHKWPPEG